MARATNGGPPWARRAVDFLRANDPVLARIIANVGALKMAYRPARFQSLVRAIIFQQLAGRAALAIYQRFVAIIGAGRFPTPAQVLVASDKDLRRAGLSRGKMAYIRDLAAHLRDGRLSFRRFARMDDEEIITELMRVRGIGRWTAEMFLMFNLRRPDVLPVDDLGFRNAVAKAYGLSRLPTPRELRSMAEQWRPYRSAAVWYLWQSTRLITPEAPATMLSGKRQIRKQIRQQRLASRLKALPLKASRQVQQLGHPPAAPSTRSTAPANRGEGSAC